MIDSKRHVLILILPLGLNKHFLIWCFCFMIKGKDGFVLFCLEHSCGRGINGTDSLVVVHQPCQHPVMYGYEYSIWTEDDPPNPYKGMFDDQEQAHMFNEFDSALPRGAMS